MPYAKNEQKTRGWGRSLSTYSSEARRSGGSGGPGGPGKSRLSGDAISAGGACGSLQRERAVGVSAGRDHAHPPLSWPGRKRNAHLWASGAGVSFGSLWGWGRRNKRSRVRGGRTVGAHGRGGKSRQRITSTPAVSRSVGDTRGRRNAD